MQPLPRQSIPQLPIGVELEQCSMRLVAAGFQRFDQRLLVIAPQPGGAPQRHQAPHQIHAGLNSTAPVDHIAAEDQMVLAWQHGQQRKQFRVAAVHITDHPMA